jgi:hypothetical protein
MLSAFRFEIGIDCVSLSDPVEAGELLRLKILLGIRDL